jgi:16S rRNA (adenine1518-N6/adenine1519-N6)-dimethyltransferase
VIEIGPGHGELTAEVIGYRLKVEGGPIRIIVIEKDPRLVELLREKFSKEKNFWIVAGDVRKTLPSLIYNLQPVTYNLCGNIPYYLTGFLLRLIGELTPPPKRVVLTIQKEVAERICATPKPMNPVRSSRAAALRTRDSVASATSNGMNQLAASVQFWARPQIIRTIPRGAFFPPPKVDSAIILLEKKKSGAKISAPAYYAAVHALFRQPRKTIVNNIADATGFTKERIALVLQEEGIAPDARPGELTVEKMSKLAARFPFSRS